MKEFYLIGSLRNPDIPHIASVFREAGVEIFDDWYSAGPHADDSWRDYERGKGNDYKTALGGYAARHVFSFDFHHLNRVSGAILVLPAGRSGHLELGYMCGKGKPTYILLDTPDRWDVMYQFATGVYDNVADIVEAIRGDT